MPIGRGRGPRRNLTSFDVDAVVRRVRAWQDERSPLGVHDGILGRLAALTRGPLFDDGELRADLIVQSGVRRRDDGFWISVPVRKVDRDAIAELIHFMGLNGTQARWNEDAGAVDFLVRSI